MKNKIIIILILTFLTFLALGQALNINKSNKIEQTTDLNIGGRLPVEIKSKPVDSKEKYDDININNLANESVIDYLDEEKNNAVDNDMQTANKIKTDIKIQSIDRHINVPFENKRLSLLEQIKVHTVQKGESLWTISHKYDINIDTIIGANDITNMNMIKEGDKLKILPVKGILYRVNPGESLWLISINFDISIDKIIKANNIMNSKVVKQGQLLILPGAKPEFGYQERMSSKLMAPVSARISSYYGMRWGRMHEGIDFAVNTGTKIKAAAAGKIIYSGWASGYGYTVIIEHQKGVRTLYAHNSKLIVHSGQYVSKGQVICLSGNTGNSTGPHLHFEVQINGRPVNPLSYIY